MAVITRLTNKVHKEADMDSAVDRIRVEHKIQADSNNGTQISILKNNVRSAAINMVKITYNPVRQRIKFVQKVPSENILQTFVNPLMLTT